MSPQFVDFDADGHLDIVAGTFSGSPWIARGSAEGWQQPEMILDAEGERIVANQFWCYEEEKWLDTKRCDPREGAPGSGHVTSAFACDYDGDGDYDLLLGDYGAGYVYLRRNNGTNAEPEFGFKNELIHAGAGPLKVDKTSTIRVLDWNGDGRDDLLVSSMGDVYGQRPGGGVFLYMGQEAKDGAQFAAQQVLVEISPKGHHDCTRPDAGLYADAGDIDGDGDMDLVVGAYSMWSPPKPELNDDQLARVDELKAAIAKVRERMNELNKVWLDAIEGVEDRKEQSRIRGEIMDGQATERGELNESMLTLGSELSSLVPSDQRKEFVWYYENERIDARVSNAR